MKRFLLFVLISVAAGFATQAILLKAYASGMLVYEPVDDQGHGPDLGAEWDGAVARGIPDTCEYYGQLAGIGALVVCYGVVWWRKVLKRGYVFGEG